MANLLCTHIGSSEANSYVTLEEAIAYMSKKSTTSSWSECTNTEKSQLLIQACLDINLHTFIGKRYYESQSLQFPRIISVGLNPLRHETYSGGCAIPCTATSFKGSNLWSATYNKIPENHFKYGSVHILGGAGAGEIRNISSSSKTTGKIVVSSPFSTSLAASSNYLVFAPIYDEIKKAQYEQALFILDSDVSTYREYKKQGLSSVSIGDVSVGFSRGTLDSASAMSVLGFYAQKYLSRYLRKDTRVNRG